MSATGTTDGAPDRLRRPRQAGPTRAAAAALVALLALVGCGKGNIESERPAASASPGQLCATGSLEGQGSSAQLNAIARWRTVYQRRCPGSAIAYTPNGSGQGVRAFVAGKADFAGSDSVLSADEQRSADARCRAGTAMHLPMAVGPIAIVYRINGLDSLKLSPATLAKIFKGTVTVWNDPAIRADNPQAVLPAVAIGAVHRSDSSGTTDNLTAYLSAAAPADWTFGRGKDWKAPGGIGATGSTGVAGAVRAGNGTVGYAELSFAENAALTVADVRTGSGSAEFVQPTPDSARRTIAGVKVHGNDLKLEIDYGAPPAAAYPIVMVTYEIICTRGLAADKAMLARTFLSYMASTPGQRELPQLGYAALPDQLQSRVEAAAGAIA